MNIAILLCLFACAYQAYGDDDIITEPRPGDEYVMVSSGQQTPVRNFESSHKIPEKHPHARALRLEASYEKLPKKIITKVGVKHVSEGIVSIEEDKKILKKNKGKVTESIEIDIPVSKIEDIRIPETSDVDYVPRIDVDLEAMSESGKLGGYGTTTQKPVLTTGAAPTTVAYDFVPINFDSIDDINTGLLSSNVNLESAGTEQKQHSRIQIKKGPNGQDYEYEYIYYYYDEDEDETKSKEKSTTAAPIHNSHDGPQKVEAENQIAKDTRNKSKYSTIDRSSTTTPATVNTSPENQNEVLPASGRGRQRGRNIVPAPVQEEIVEDRLPSSTRFPPRGRNLATSTTYVPEVTEVSKPRGRIQAESNDDINVQTSRSRPRAHIRRPSSELVDLDSFKTNSGDASNQYKEPTRYTAESKTTTEYYESTTVKEPAPREGHSIISGIRFQEIVDDSKLPADYKTTTTYEQDTTEHTTMTAMEKVALDLYAYLAGENLNNEVNPTSTDNVGFDGTTTVEDDVTTTEALTTTEEVTTTTTTTTTTPAPTTTTTAAPTTRASRFKLRPGARGRATLSTTTTTTEVPQESSTKARARFGRPRSPLSRTTTTTAASAVAEPELTASSAAPAFRRPQPRPLIGRRTTTPRTPSTTKAAPSDDTASSGSASSAVPASVEPSSDASTASSILGRRPGLRPLRPGLNLPYNLRPRGKASPVTPAAVVDGAASDSNATSSAAPEGEEQEASVSSAAPTLRPRKKLTVSSVSPAPSTSPRTIIGGPRRPLLKRRLSPEPSSTTPKPSTAAAADNEEAPTTIDESPAPSSEQPTTASPPKRRLEALLARRRASRPPVKRAT